MLNRPSTLLTAIILLGCGTFMVSLFFIVRFGADKASENFATLPTGVPSTTQNAPTTNQDSFVEYFTEDDVSIYFRDPREFETTTSVGGGVYMLTPLLDTDPPPYGVVFNETDASFAVGLEQEPLAQSRLQAEEYLRTELGVSNTELCEMAIFVSVPSRVNQFYAGKNLGLSFCPGATLLQ